MQSLPWQPLKPGDSVKIIAPASAVSAAEQMLELENARALLTSWDLKPVIAPTIFQPNAIMSGLANSDDFRIQDLHSAIFDPSIAAIWCFRGGYGSIRLLQALDQWAPTTNKLFIGFSDITLLHLYFNQRWQWATVHGPVIRQVVNDMVIPEDIASLKQLMFGMLPKIRIDNLIAMNEIAHQATTIEASLIGGNATLVNRTLGTPYAINIKNKILFLEDVEEPARKVDGMLYQMYLAGYFSQNNKPQAIILGDFSIKDDAEKKDVTTVLQTWASVWNDLGIPVLSCEAIGHGNRNYPIPIGTKANLQLGQKPHLICEAGFGE